MSYTIIRHPLIETDLENISDLVADYAGNRIALAKIDVIENDLQNLINFPHIGTIRDEIHPGLRAIPTAEKGVVAFTIDDDTRTVLVIAITYAGADWINIVRERQK